MAPNLVVSYASAKDRLIEQLPTRLFAERERIRVAALQNLRQARDLPLPRLSVQMELEIESK